MTASYIRMYCNIKLYKTFKRCVYLYQNISSKYIVIESCYKTILQNLGYTRNLLEMRKLENLKNSSFAKTQPQTEINQNWYEYIKTYL